MELRDAILTILEGNAILFAGSGYSYGAKNKFGKNLPNGMELNNVLKEKCNKIDSSYNLGKIANYFQKVFSTEELISVIKEHCTNVSHKKYHEIISSLKWRRIYTTNYDKVIECSALKANESRIIMPVTYSDNKNDVDITNVCVHVNGYIDKLNLQSIKDEFKLTDYSYNCDTLIGNPWYDLMVEDFTSARAIVVIGYSMEFDVDILRLFSVPGIKDKVIFITKNDEDDIAENTFNDYGRCYKIGIEGFADEVLSVASTYKSPVVDLNFRSFFYENRVINMVTELTFEQINRIFTMGEIANQMFAKLSSGEYKYFFNRSKISNAINNILAGKSILILSDLGNGKSVFVSMLKKELLDKKIEIFSFEHRYSDIDEEIIKICNKKNKVVVVIENYSGFIDILRKFNVYGCRNISFILTERSAVNNVFYYRLCKSLNIDKQQLYIIPLNYLTHNEIKDFYRVLYSNGVTQKNELEFVNDIINKHNSNLSIYLLSYFKSSKIKNELVKLYSSLEKTNDKKLKETAIFLLLKSVSNYDLDILEMMDLLGANYNYFLRDNSQFLLEIFDVSTGLVKVKSSIIALELLKNAINFSDIVDVMIKVFKEADKRNSETFIEFKKKLVSHSQFVRMLSDKKSNAKEFNEIERFYEEIRNTRFAKKNPFYWEQFASSYLDMKNYSMSEKCLKNSLEIAEKIPTFVPFQIKTIYGRYYVESCIDKLINEGIDCEMAINSIIDANNLMFEFYDNPENNIYYVFKVAYGYKEIFDLCYLQFDKRQISIFIEQVQRIVNKMNNYLIDNSNNNYGNYDGKISKWKDELVKIVEKSKVILKSI